MATVRIQVRRGTASQWSTTNPVLAAGEMGVETDTNLFKFGNGTSTWTALSYANNSDVAISEISQDAINNALSLGAGLTKSYNDGTNTIEITVDSDVIALKSYVDEREVWIQNQADSAYIPQEDRGAVNGVASLNAQGKVPTSEIDLTVVATREYADFLQGQDLFALQTHTGKTTNVHGIADTTQLVTNDFLASEKADAISTAADSAASALSAAISTEVDNRNSAIAAEVTNLNTAIENEATARASLETALHGYADGAVSTHSASTANVHGIADTTLLATKSYADTAADEAETAATSAASTALSTHAADTTSVHGISNTAELETQTGAQAKADNALTSAETYADSLIGDVTVDGTPGNTVYNRIDSAKDYTNSQIDSHVAVTTNVHGIADTSKIVLTDSQATTLDGSLTVDGNLTVNGTTFSASATSITIEDNLVQLAHQNAANTVDLGLVVAYNDGSAKHSGIVRDVSSDSWKLFKGVTTEPTTTVDFTQGSLDDLAVKNLRADSVVYPDGTQTKEGVPSRTPIIQKSGSYTLSNVTERDSLIEVSSGSATTITIPAEASVNYPVGTSIDILQTSTGQVTIAGAAGVTVNATPGLKLRTQWSSASLLKRAADTWVVMGDLSA
jgi:hypothetical protein